MASRATTPTPTTPDLVVGGTLQVALRQGKRTTATIKAVGRKWVTLTVGSAIRTYRFAIPSVTPFPATVALDGGGYNSPGDVIFDSTALDLASSWRAFRALVNHSHHAPEGVNLEAIEAARKALGL